MPDIVINAPKPVTVAISAQYIPVGTVVNLYITYQFGPDSMVACAPLAGTLASSTAKCSGVTFPGGIAITEIRAMW